MIIKYFHYSVVVVFFLFKIKIKIKTHNIKDVEGQTKRRGGRLSIDTKINHYYECYEWIFRKILTLSDLVNCYCVTAKKEVFFSHENMFVTR